MARPASRTPADRPNWSRYDPARSSISTYPGLAPTSRGPAVLREFQEDVYAGMGGTAVVKHRGGTEQQAAGVDAPHHPAGGGVKGTCSGDGDQGRSPSRLADSVAVLVGWHKVDLSSILLRVDTALHAVELAAGRSDQQLNLWLDFTE